MSDLTIWKWKGFHCRGRPCLGAPVRSYRVWYPIWYLGRHIQICEV